LIVYSLSKNTVKVYSHVKKLRHGIGHRMEGKIKKERNEEIKSDVFK
jgi:hypothetical protein